MPPKFYLSGPMSGLPEFNYPAFNAAAAAMRSRGFDVENPAEHNLKPDADWGDYMRHAIPRLLTCSSIALLPGWQKSRGARLEIYIATELGMTVTSVEDLCRSTHIKLK